MKGISRGALIGLGVIVSGIGFAASAAELKVGDPAPDFSMVGSDGKSYSLADFQGKKAVVLAWYPKAFTGGCTAECKSFREKGDVLKPLNVAYFTASVDTPEENKKFSESLGLDYPILSDPDKTAAKAFGVLGARGEAQRWTFYIDKDGVIREIDKTVNSKNAAPDVAEKLAALKIAE